MDIELLYSALNLFIFLLIIREFKNKKRTRLVTIGRFTSFKMLAE